ncbi:hypothetical protein DSCOOX_27340 [Desulfosarcina ovata subsp. ovata]|uniref:Uncharacterized protein n=1 Tax=Desulfosarcina ovata subsp. ovata TaxID=2752305 RepID=A0A5K8AC01_9BACT|nr:hypothetical protein DSCOOX_27340 [Desulfosarcina ovata subsp. ovata]
MVCDVIYRAIAYGSLTLIQIEIAIEIEKKWDVDMQTGCLSPFCQPVIPIYIVDFDSDSAKPELLAIALALPS